MASLRKAIDDMCKSCTYDSTQPGGWRIQVQSCTVKSCSLWEVRPMSSETIIQVRRKNAEEKVSLDDIIEGLEDA